MFYNLPVQMKEMQCYMLHNACLAFFFSFSFLSLTFKKESERDHL